jgi:hypothetical protein
MSTCPSSEKTCDQLWRYPAARTVLFCARAHRTISRTPCLVRGMNVTAGVLRTVRPQFRNSEPSRYLTGLPSASRRRGCSVTARCTRSGMEAARETPMLDSSRPAAASATSVRRVSVSRLGSVDDGPSAKDRSSGSAWMSLRRLSPAMRRRPSAELTSSRPRAAKTRARPRARTSSASSSRSPMMARQSRSLPGLSSAASLRPSVRPSTLSPVWHCRAPQASRVDRPTIPFVRARCQVLRRVTSRTGSRRIRCPTPKRGDGQCDNDEAPRARDRDIARLVVRRPGK